MKLDRNDCIHVELYEKLPSNGEKTLAKEGEKIMFYVIVVECLLLSMKKTGYDEDQRKSLLEIKLCLGGSNRMLHQ